MIDYAFDEDIFWYLSKLPLVLCLCVIVILAKKYIVFISMDEQLFIYDLTSRRAIDGPQTVIVNPLTTKHFEVRSTLSLGPSEYCVVRNFLSGEKHIEQGPKLVRLGAYDEVVVKGGSNFNTTSFGRGCGHIPTNVHGNGKRTALSLKANEYVRFIDNKTGKVRCLKGEQGCVVPGPYEDYLDGKGKMKAMDLKVYEYIKIQDTETGKVRVERGPKLVFLGPFEEFERQGKQNAIAVDDETAVLILNKSTGEQTLITDKKLFVPSHDEEVVEVRKKIKLADYEACIVRDKTGKDIFYFGSNGDEERSFFLPPYSEVLELLWSRGRRRELRDLRIQKIDLRPMFMSYEISVRTNDNVELILEGSFFWEVVDLKSMIKVTNDTTGDICNHARSRFSELVSKVTLQEFMTQFNVIAKKVHEEDESNFYGKRGVKIHSLEVTHYRCAESTTALVLEQIIQETTNRLNRLQHQESENEVQLQEIKGDIEEEKARSELIHIQTLNSNAKAKMEGMAEAAKLASFLSELQKNFPDMDIKTHIDMWNVLRKEDALKAVSNNEKATLYFTPDDVNLSIQNHDHKTKTSKLDDF